MRRRSFTSIAIIIGVYGAASVIAGLIKIPSPVGSVAFDAVPAYFVAGYYGPFIGGVVGTIGHLGSAASSGFMLGPLHLVIAALMFVWCSLFGFILRSVRGWVGIVAAVAAAVATNGVIAPLVLIPFGLPQATAIALIPFLSLASLANALLAALGARFLARQSAVSAQP